MVAGLRVADSAVFCVKASAGIEAGGEMVWDRGEERGCPVLCLVTQMDKEHASFAKALETGTTRVGERIVPPGRPICGRDNVRGLVELVSMKGERLVEDG